jgi:hypothetical protein
MTRPSNSCFEASNKDNCIIQLPFQKKQTYGAYGIAPLKKTVTEKVTNLMLALEVEEKKKIPGIIKISYKKTFMNSNSNPNEIPAGSSFKSLLQKGIEY